MRAVADNDVLLKGACYGLLKPLVSTVSGRDPVGILGASRFVVAKKIARNQLRGDPARAAASFATFVSENEILEPSLDERHMAGIFEAIAQELALNLDVGESQLLAILICRCLPCLLTGDKRAIKSIERLLDADERVNGAAGKVRCLEQLVLDTLKVIDALAIRAAICAEPNVDRALTICFSCGSSQVNSTTIHEGLESYIADLRSHAPRVLATS